MARMLFVWFLAVQHNNGLIVLTFLTTCHNNGHNIWDHVHPARLINGLIDVRVVFDVRATMNLLVNELRSRGTLASPLSQIFLEEVVPDRVHPCSPALWPSILTLNLGCYVIVLAI